jgi:prolyl 4-hydroxylase
VHFLISTNAKNFTEEGYRKVRAPPALQKILSEFWENNKNNGTIENWGRGAIYTNHWLTPTQMIPIQDPDNIGGGPELADAVWEVARKEVEEWTGMKVRPSSVYGIRVYSRGSILSPHVDRLPLVSSCIVNVAQDVEEPWPLEVYDRNNRPINITMEPFDMVFYESHSLLHGRPFPLKGNFFANIFIHFENYGERTDGTMFSVHDDPFLPPYVIPDTEFAATYANVNPIGWSRALTEVEFETMFDMVAEDRIDEIQVLLDQDPKLANVASQGSLWRVRMANGFKVVAVLTFAISFLLLLCAQLLHEAVSRGNLDMVQLLVSRGADINARTDDNYSPYWMAVRDFGHDHPITGFLEVNGADTAEVDNDSEEYHDEDEENWANTAEVEHASEEGHGEYGKLD